MRELWEMQTWPSGASLGWGHKGSAVAHTQETKHTRVIHASSGLPVSVYLHAAFRKQGGVG